MSAPARRVQLLVWCLAVFSVLGAAWFVTPSESRVLRSPVAAASLVTTDSSRQVPVAGTPARSVVLAGHEDGLTDYKRPAPATTCTTSSLDDRAVKLPSARWNDPGLESPRTSRFDIATPIISLMATAGFIIASLLWIVLLFVIRLGTSADFLCAVGTPINQGAAALAGDLKGVTIVIVAIAIFRAGMKLFKGRQKEAISLLVAAVMGMAGVFTVGTMSQDAARQGVTGTNTLPGIAADIQQKLNAASDGLTSLSTNLGVPDQGSGAAITDENGGTPNCTDYITEIYEDYNKENDRAGRFGASSANGVASRLWENTFLSSWTAAQFGPSSVDNTSAQRASCRLLELRAGTPRLVQHELLKRTGIPDLDTFPGEDGDNHKNSGALRILGPISDEKLRREAVIAWAACRTTDGKTWEASSEWDTALGADASNGQDSWDDICSVVLGTGVGTSAGNRTELRDRLGWNNNLDFKEAKNFDAAFGNCDQSTCRDPRNFVRSYMGANAGQRLVEGVLSIFTAGIFLFSLGSIALGCFVAQIMLMMLLILLPVTLTLCAMKSAGGPKLLKLTGTTLVSAFLFSMLLAVLSSLINVGHVIVSALTTSGYGVGFFGRILQAFIPIAILLLLKKILAAAGMGDITKMSGALGFMAAASARATGDKSIQAKVGNGMNGLGRGLGGIPLGRKDKEGNRRTLGSLDDKSFEKRAFGVAKFGGKKTAQAVAALSRKKLPKAVPAALPSAIPLGGGLEMVLPGGGRRLPRSAAEAAAAAKLAAQKKGGEIADGFRDNKGRSRWLLLAAAGAAAAGTGGAALLLPGAAALGVARLTGRSAQQRLADKRRADRAAGRTDSEGENYEYIDPETGKPMKMEPGDPGFIQDTEYVKDRHERFRRTADHMRQYRPGDLKEHYTNAAEEDLEASVVSRLGADAFKALQLSPTGTLDDAQKQALQKAVADQLGLRSDMILVSPSGLTALSPAAREFDKESKRYVVAPDTEPQALQSNAFWLPHQERKYTDKEKEEAAANGGVSETYVRRINAALDARGLRVDGVEVDALKAHFGMSVDNPADMAEIAAWISGQKNTRFDTFSLPPADASEERTRVAAGAAWEQKMIDAAEAREKLKLEAAQKEIEKDAEANEKRRQAESSASEAEQKKNADAGEERRRKEADVPAGSSSAGSAGGGGGRQAENAGGGGGGGGGGGSDPIVQALRESREEMAKSLSDIADATKSVSTLIGELKQAQVSGNADLSKTLTQSIVETAQASAAQLGNLKDINDAIETSSYLAQSAARGSDAMFEEKFEKSQRENERLQAKLMGELAQLRQSGDTDGIQRVIANMERAAAEMQSNSDRAAQELEQAVVSRRAAEERDPRRTSAADPQQRLPKSQPFPSA